MPMFDSLGRPINNNDDKSSPATESTTVEIRHDGFGNDNHSRYSAEPNMSDASSIDLSNAIKNLNTNNSQGGNSGENN